MKALVVDDSRAIRRILARMLAGCGFEVTEACHGKDALDKLREVGAHDVALVDWNMPEMNGLELVSAVRADHGLDAMKIVMVTTETEIENVNAALGAGANEYVMKPFTEDVIREKLSLIGVRMGGDQ